MAFFKKYVKLFEKEQYTKISKINKKRLHILRIAEEKNNRHNSKAHENVQKWREKDVKYKKQFQNGSTTGKGSNGPF